MRASLIVVISLLVQTTTSQPIQCGNTTTYCHEDGKCCFATYSPTKFGCKLPTSNDLASSIQSSDTTATFPPSPTASCCMPGPELPPSTTLPNCLVIGDSVSIGYVGTATQNISDIALLQHGPWDVSGKSKVVFFVLGERCWF